MQKEQSELTYLFHFYFDFLCIVRFTVALTVSQAKKRKEQQLAFGGVAGCSFFLKTKFKTRGLLYL
jgi:hypothetical protein